MPTSDRRETFHFLDFDLDVARYELRRNGRAVKIERQPMDILILLVERRGLLVSRSDIADRLWGKDVFVDVEAGVHTVIRKIRQALRDSPERSAFVETVPGKGYRFVAPVEVMPAALAPDRLSRITLAVLPFVSLGIDSAREYLADGLTGDTSASLAQIDPERLTVKGRTLGYKRTTKTVAEIGRELGVDYLVESTVLAEGTRIRVTVTLIRVRDQEHVWSHTYGREATSLLGLQEELSADIAEQVHLRVSANRVTGIGRRQTRNAAAYDEYLRARHLQNKRTPQANALAVQGYQRAIALDPEYALAWSGLALTYAASAINADARPSDVAPRARDAAARALRAGPDLAEAELSSGYVKWLLDWDWTAAEDAIRRAIELDPSNAAAQRSLGHVLSQWERHEEAEASMRRARELEPFDGLVHALSAQIASQARRYADASQHARRAMSVDSELWIGYMVLADAYIGLGENDVALEALADAARLSGGNSKALAWRGYLLARTGRTIEARELIKTLESLSRERYVPPYADALVYAGLGEREAAFAALDKAYAERDVHLIFLPVDPKWDPYRDDPRLRALLARCGFTGIVDAPRR
jgi:TolB-like protein/Tfp pilus assembly protein PilF